MDNPLCKTCKYFVADPSDDESEVVQGLCVDPSKIIYNRHDQGNPSVDSPIVNDTWNSCSNHTPE